MPIAPCPSCRSEHLGGDCHLSFRDRLLTTQVHAGALETRTKRNYFDSEAVAAAFGADSEEVYLEETRGLGAPKRAADGSEWVYDDPKTGARRPLENSDIQGGYLRGPVEELSDGELDA